MKGRYTIISLKFPDDKETDVLVAYDIFKEMIIDVQCNLGKIKMGVIKDTGLFHVGFPVLTMAPTAKGKPWKTLPEQYENEVKG